MNKKEKIKQRKEELRREVHESGEKFFLELNKAKKNTVELSENAFLMAGSVVMGFVFFQVLRNRKHTQQLPKRRSGQLSLAGFSFRNRVYKRFLQYLTMFLLGIARRKLVDFLLEDEHEKIGNTEGSLQEQG